MLLQANRQPFWDFSRWYPWHSNKWNITSIRVAWENSQHFAMPPLISPWNDVCEMTTEIQCWWHATKVPLIGWGKFSPVAQPIRSTTYIWVMTSHQCGISAFFPQKSFCRETSGYQCNKMSAGFSGYRELCSQTFRCWGIACRGEQKGFWKGNSLYCCSLAIFLSSALLFMHHQTMWTPGMG